MHFRRRYLILTTILLFSLLIIYYYQDQTRYGGYELKKLKNEEIIELAEKLEIPEEKLFQLDTTFWTYLKSVEAEQTIGMIKNHYQPLKALYYNKQGELISFHINCLAPFTKELFPMHQWNYYGQFNTFPPMPVVADSLLPLDTLITYIKPLNTSSTYSKAADYKIFIFWNKWNWKQSKGLIDQVRSNLKLNKKYYVDVLYVNNDNFCKK